MRISIEGLADDVEERARDHLAETIASSLKRLRLQGRLSSAQFTFASGQSTNERLGSSPGFPATTKVNSRREEDNDSIRLDRLLAQPSRTSQNLRLDGAARDALESAISRFGSRSLVYEDWGLAEIDATPRLALNFSGPPGSGKTMSAHYLASRLQRPIVEVSYADVVSKYFGEAAKNLAALFSFAFAQGAVLFIDEAETLLSKRSESSAGGVDHAVNSMRSQLLTLIDRTPVLTIFATNLLGNYDPAFLSRLITIRFSSPGEALQAEIWASHLPAKLPLEADVSPAKLVAACPGLNGRQICRSVIEAAHRAAAQGKGAVSIEDFRWASGFVTSTCD